MSARPYFAADPAAWMVVLELLPRPLEPEAVLLDLAHLENEVRRGQAFPSLSKLRSRWGWGRKRVEQALAGELGDWHDPARPLELEQLRAVGRAANRAGPGSTQRYTQKSTQATVEPVESTDQEHAEVHAEEHAGEARDRSRARQDHEGSTGQQASLVCAQAPVGDQPDQPGRTDPSDLSVVELASEPDRARWKRSAVLAVYEHWRGYHARAATLPGDDEVDTIRAAVEICAKVAKGGRGRFDLAHYVAARDELCDLCDWMHTAADAAWWQGANPKAQKYLGVSSCFKRQKLSDRLGQMRSWRERGREQNPDLGIDRHLAEGERAWAYLGRILLRHADLPDPVHADQRAHVAIHAGIRACGGEAAIRRAGPAQERELCETFARGYATARRDLDTGAIKHRRAM